MTVLIQVRAPHDDEGQAIIERIHASLPPGMKSVTGSLPGGRQAPTFRNALLMKFRAPAENAAMARHLIGERPGATGSRP